MQFRNTEGTAFTALLSRATKKWRNVEVVHVTPTCWIAATDDSVDRNQKLSIANVDGLLVAYDGQLHNCADLWKEFCGQRRDTPKNDVISVLGAGYRSRGMRILERLVGDWVVAIYDPSAETLVLGRDYPGARTLFYAIRPEGMVWSTDLDVIGGHEPFASIDRDYCTHFIGAINGSLRTPYAGVRQLPGGGGVEASSTRARVFQSYSLHEAIGSGATERRAATDKFRDLLSRAVSDRLNGNSPVALLSGGWDSSSIACFANLHLRQRGGSRQNLTTVTVHYDDTTANSDKYYSSLVNNHIGAESAVIEQGKSRPWFPPPRDQLLACSPTVPSLMPMELKVVCEQRQASVLLSGEGGDLIGVSSVRPYTLLGDLWQRRSLWTFQRELLRASRVFGCSPWSLLFRDVVGQRERVLGALANGTHAGGPRPRIPWLKQFAPPDTTYDQKVIRSLTSSQLTYLLGMQKFQQVLARDFFELLRPLRVSYPFLDRRLVEFCYSLPIEMKISASQPRQLHRDAVNGVVPAELLTRRDKGGIGQAIVREIRRSWEWIESVLGVESRLAEYGIVDPHLARSALRDVRDTGNRYKVAAVYNTLNLELWLRGYDCKDGTS